MANRRKKKPNKRRKIFSFSFLLSIPLTGMLFYYSAYYLVLSIALRGFPAELAAVFFLGSICGYSLMRGNKFPRFRTFIHELKHFIGVVLTGNRVTGFEVNKHTGSVSYTIGRSTMHFEPYIVLAPYCMPLLSLPCLLLGLALEASARAAMTLLLGFCLAFDITSNMIELHPHQSDLTVIRGGKKLSISFIFIFNLAWSALCIIWAFDGNYGFISLAKFIIYKITHFIA